MINIETLNTYSLSQLCGAEVNCGCGVKHTVETKDIAVSAGAVDELPKMIEKIVAPLVRVQIVSDKTCFNLFGNAVEKVLLKHGFKVGRFVYDDGVTESVENADKLLDLPEDTKALIAVGGGKVFDMVKYAAVKLKMPVFGVMASPATDAYLSQFSMLYNKGFKEIYVTKAPAGLIADMNMAGTGGEALIAAGFGTAAAKRIALIDWRFSALMTGEKYCPHIAQQAIACISEIEKISARLAQNDRAAVCLLTENILRLSLLNQLLQSSRLSNGGETHLCHALQGMPETAGKIKRLYGEALFLSAAFLSKIYCAFFKTELTDFVPPPDLNLRAEKLAAYFKAKEGDSLKRVRPYMAPESYALYAHKLKEYRPELYADALSADAALTADIKVFKRLYSDAGFWMKDFLTEQDYRPALALAPDLREKYTVLTYMRDLGLLDKYL